MVKKEYISPSVKVFIDIEEPLLQSVSAGGTLEEITEEVTDTPAEGGMEADSKKFNIWDD